MTIPRQRLAEIALVAALLAAHGWLAVSSTTEKSVTFDEVAHLGAGILYWQAGDYRFNAESGILPQRWAALPFLWQPVSIPEADHPARRQANVWAAGRDILFGRGNATDQVVARARGMIAAASALLGAAVYVGSRALFGPAGALLSLVLYAVSPTILAHGRLVSADLFAALFFLLASAAIWKLFHRITVGRLAAAVAAVAGLLLSKHSGLLIVPIAALLAAARLARGVRRRQPLVASFAGRRLRLRAPAVAALVLVVLFAVWGTVWAAYGFRYAADPAAEDGSTFLHSWESLLAAGGPTAGAVAAARELRLLPEAYLWGLAYTLDTTRERDAFLAGRHSQTGWWWFFPYAAAVKTPLALVPLLLLAAWAWARARSRRRRWWSLYRSAPLWTLLAVYGTAAVASHLNIGHRHLLPVYPVLFLLAGGAAAWFRKPPSGRSLPAAALVALLTAAFAGESWAVRPHYLAYFNQLAGGPANGYRHLVDSSLDWGQDLPALAAWIDDFRAAGPQAAATPIYVSYLGAAVPAHYGVVDVEWLASYFPLADPARPPRPLAGGVYCVSATLLQSVHLGVLGPWNPHREREYQERRAEVERFIDLTRDDAGRRRLATERTVAEWMETFRAYDRLRSARLFRTLRGRQPEARAGYSILIYRLSDAEVRQALSGPPPDR